MTSVGENHKKAHGFSIDRLLGRESQEERNDSAIKQRTPSPEGSTSSDTSGVEQDPLHTYERRHTLHTCHEGGPCLPCFESRRSSPASHSSSLPVPPRPSPLLMRFREDQMPPFHDKYLGALAGLPSSCFGAGEHGFSKSYDKTCMPHPSLWLASQQEGINPYAWTINSGLPQFNVASDSSFLLPHFRKPKRIRTAFAPSQLLRLEHAFEKNHYVVGQERKELAIGLSLTETQVKVWFQNRRTKFKRMKAEEEMTRTLTKNLQNKSNTDSNKRVFPKSKRRSVQGHNWGDASESTDEDSEIDV